jgi:hypothetical protein
MGFQEGGWDARTGLICLRVETGCCLLRMNVRILQNAGNFLTS